MPPAKKKDIVMDIGAKSQILTHMQNGKQDSPNLPPTPINIPVCFVVLYLVLLVLCLDRMEIWSVSELSRLAYDRKEMQGASEPASKAPFPLQL